MEELNAPAQTQDTLERALFEIKRVIAGQDRMLERVLVCLLAGGHLLIEGVPGYWDGYMYPGLGSHTERVTLISCGGTFIPNPGGLGGAYNGRIVLIAERWVP